MQTLAIAAATDRRIVGLDSHQPYLQRLKRSAEAAGLREQISLVHASMHALPFAEGSFDVIWSEGAIYIAGFERGLREWHPFLRPRGYVVVSELTWLQTQHPAEAAEFWQAGYPGMHSVEENLEIIGMTGYREVGHFTLEKSSWWEHYYTPLEARLGLLRARYVDDAVAISQLDSVARQIDLYRKYSDSYGYVFYVMQSSTNAVRLSPSSDRRP